MIVPIRHGSDPAAWASGGWIGYESDWIGDVLKLGAVGYTSLPLWAPEDRVDTLLLKDGTEVSACWAKPILP